MWKGPSDFYQPMLELKVKSGESENEFRELKKQFQKEKDKKKSESDKRIDVKQKNLQPGLNITCHGSFQGHTGPFGH